MRAPTGFLYTVVPVVSSSPAYSSNDAIGGSMSFTLDAFAQDQGCILEAVTISDAAKQSANVDLFLFNPGQTPTTGTDNTAYDPSAANIKLAIACLSITTHFITANRNLSVLRGLQLPIPLPATQASRTMICQLVARSTPTFAAVTDIQVSLLFRPQIATKG